MGKFETYPEATTLENSDITLYNKSSITHKVTFGRLVNLIKSKIAESGLITSINTGAGLTGGEITSSGTIKCKLKSEVPSSLASVSVSTTADRQYPVNLDRDGNLSVNVPWAGDTYIGEKGVTVANNKISATLKNNTPSSLSSASMGSTADRQYAVGLDIDGKLSVNIPWTDTVGMTTNGSNANSHVNFAGAFTVGSRKENSTIGVNSTAEGSNTTASGDYSHAEGERTTASGAHSHAEGYSTEAKLYASHAEGTNTISNNNYAHAEGCKTEANGEASHAEGQYTEANGNYSSVKGCGNNGLYYYSDISELDTTVNHSISANGTGSSAEGYTEYDENQQFELRSQSIIQANGRGSHAEGCAVVNLQSETDSMIIAYGDGSHAEGYADGESIILASGLGSHAEGGVNTTASGDYSHAEGGGTTAIGYRSHAEGSGTTASGANSHAEGYSTQANGNTSHAEGSSTKANGNYSHAEGSSAKSTGNYSHAENFNTTASAQCSHAEGCYTTASGSYSHAEGNYAISYGKSSHAEGDNTEANGDYSHAGGYYAVAPLVSQFVHGGYNKKFGESSSNYRGVFGFQPDGKYYTTDTAITDAYNGSGGTASANVTVRLSLKPCAMYMLCVAVYDAEGWNSYGSLFMITTPKMSVQNPYPQVSNISQDFVQIDEESGNVIAINSEYDYMFHLIRIM